MSVTAVLESLKNYADLRIDSRLVQPGDVFIAIPGLTTDGRKYIAQAIANGAAAVLYEPQDCVIDTSNTIPHLPVENLAAKLPELAAAYYMHPSITLKILAVTGTNGKSSTTHYIAQFLAALKLQCGVMGTLGNGLYPNLQTAALTTSDCCTLQSAFKNFINAGAQYATLEVSSHALDQERFAQTQIDTAIFTNLSQDHLDYHKTMDAYFIAKSKLFTDFNAKHCVINLDDTYAARLLNLIPKHVKVITYSVANPDADVYLNNNILRTPWGEGVLQTQLIGAFNLSNILAAISVCALQDISLDRLLQLAKDIKPVLGRMELIATGAAFEPKVVVDYAHTPDALIKALQALRAYKPRTLYCVFGCGGDRDRTKRPLMMQAVIANSDVAVVTRDNPRTEDAQQIVQDMLVGTTNMHNISIELDRAQAIQQTIARASKDDIILIAGKGHEDYQIIGTTIHSFSDQKVAREALQTQLLLQDKTACN